MCQIMNQTNMLLRHDYKNNLREAMLFQQKKVVQALHALLVLGALGISGAVLAGHDEDIELDEIDVTGTRAIDSRIQKHPATVETYTKKQIEDNINAVTAAQTLKYLPSIQVRERYIGDRNGIIATRTIGTLSSAQSMLYADGVLLSNLLGNSFAFPPRWGMVSPEEIESISMMYGPFSSIYAGNSFGGVMSIKTRMPTKFEAHANVQAIRQSYELYGTDEQYDGQHLSASIGNKVGDVSFWLGADHLDNEGQPMSFSSTTSTTGVVGQVVTGAYQDKDVINKDRVVFGATSIDETRQDQVKFKIAYDITPEIKVAYTIGLWDLSGETHVQSYLKDVAGNTVYNGPVNYNGTNYTASGFSPGETESLHIMQAFDLQSNTKGFFDWQFTLSDYDYQKDLSRSSKAPSNETVAAGNPYLNRTGSVTDLSGTGWTVFDARATLRPKNHELDIGYHIDQYELNSVSHITDDWSVGNKGALDAAAQGETQTQALFVQDKWQINPQWALTTGLRGEYWQADNGSYQKAATIVNYKSQTETKFSPKLSLSYEPQPAWGFRASLGQAFRFPTVGELFQPLQNGAAKYYVQSNPNLKPEEVIAAELTAERRFESGLLRVSLFNEEKYDALISQSLATGSAIPYDTGTCTNTSPTGCTFTQNVDHIRTTGIEFAADWEDAFVHGLDLMGSLTLTDSEIIENEAAPDTEGNKSLRIPRSMVKLVATYHQGHNLTYSLAARYSGRQYNALDNSDVNPDTFGGASKFFVVDVKANYKLTNNWTASAGVDNLNNYKSYVFHPYPQRTGYLQVKFDY
jgi:iron complex outermembrane recepter protein